MPTRAIPAALALALALGACGSGDEPDQVADSRTEDQLDDTTGDSTTPSTGDADEAGDTTATTGSAGSTGERGPAGRITESGTYTCDDGDVAVAGFQVEVELTDGCSTVTISGSGNQVTVADAGSVVIGGSGHTVAVRSADSIALNGAGHSLTHGGDAQIEDNSVNSTIERDGGSGEGVER